MDINDFRGLMTALTMFAFLGVCAWAYSSKRKRDFEAIADLPLEEDDLIKTASEEKS
jgi:cytochrome c oxidase cbb3-type subunit 4